MHRTVFLACTLFLAACGGASLEPSPDAGDAAADAAGGSDAAGGTDAADTAADAAAAADAARPDGAADGAADTTADSAGDAGPGPDAAPDTGPFLTPVFAVRERPAPVADTPWAAARVSLVRTTDALPDLDVRAVDSAGGTVWAATATGLYVRRADDAAFRPVALPEGAVVADVRAGFDSATVAVGGTFCVVTPDQGCTGALPPDEPAVTQLFSCQFLLGYLAGGVIHWWFDDELGGAARPLESLADVRAAGCGDAGFWALRDDGVWRSDENNARLVWPLPDGEAPVALVAEDGRVVAATDRRAVVLDAAGVVVEEWEAAVDGLPADGVRALALAPGGGWAVGHATGVSVRTPDGPRAFAHRHSLRWLPADGVNDLAFAPDGSLWVATAAGLAHHAPEETTLAAKAERLFAVLDRYDRLGFVPPDGRLTDEWQPDGPLAFDDNDNDGQWSEEALAALCYAYAATGEERYRTRARRILDGMFLLFDVPAVSFAAAGREPGFVARSVVRDDEGALFDAKATQSNWHRVTFRDGHDYYWKDDTSSDETTGHWYGLPVYHDLCADEAERGEVARRLGELMDSLLAHDLQLVDLDGERTEHGYWDPDSLAIAIDGVQACLAEHPVEACADAWGGGAFLNSLEILGGLLATWHVTGDPRYYEAYEALVTTHRYAELATFSTNSVTWSSRALANYCDHELADLAFLTLLRYEPDAERRAVWLASQEAAWAFEEGERNPLKALAFAAATAEDGAWLPLGVRTLREYPEDRRDWASDKSHRKDLARDVNDRFGRPQFRTAPPYDEVHVMRWDGNPYRITDGAGGRSAFTPTFWLLPYWGLRYHGAIAP